MKGLWNVFTLKPNCIEIKINKSTKESSQEFNFKMKI